MRLKRHFKFERRLIAALISGIVVYLIVNLLGTQLGISDGIDPNTMKLIALTAIVSAFATKLIHEKLKC